MASLTSAEVGELAHRILVAYDAGAPGEPFAGREADWLSLSDAYRVQDAVAALRRGRGERCIGYKIGCVGTQIQRQLGILHPVRGRLWDTETYSSGSCIPSSRFTDLAVEGEIAVRLARDVSAHQDPRLACIESWFPIIELHHHVFRGPRPTAQELVANNALHAGLVSSPQSSDPDLQVLVNLRINVEVNGERVETQNPASLPGGLEASLRWLASTLELSGEHLNKGDLILTGSLGRLIPVLGGSVAVVAADGKRVDFLLR